MDDQGTTQDLSDDDWTVYGLDDGLPSNRITALDLDEAGNLWIGTRPYPNPNPQGPATIGGGVCVFDGTTCAATFTTENSSMGSNYVLTVYAAGGEVWVAARGAGVTLFHGRESNQTFDKNNSGLAGNYVSSIARDAAGKVWFAAADAAEIGRGSRSWRVAPGAHESGISTTWVGTQSPWPTTR